jgi:predicted RNA binding protein with dsRBD fold (UPF0201 family)
MQAMVSVLVHPTEDKQSVLQGLSNLFGITIPNESQVADNLELVHNINHDSLDILRKRVFELRIIDVVRSELRDRWDGFRSSLILSKQTALRGIVSVLDNSMGPIPLGGIEVRIDFDDENEFEEFLSWFAPRTQDGRVVEN